MRKLALLAAGGIMAAGLGTAGIAHADTNTDVSADATITTALTVTGINPAVHFGSGAPGSVLNGVPPQQFHVITNGNGATVSISSIGGGYYDSQTGSTKVINADATSITTQTGPKNIANSGPTLLEQVGPGDTALTEQWSLSLPSNMTYAGAVSGGFKYMVVGS